MSDDILNDYYIKNDIKDTVNENLEKKPIIYGEFNENTDFLKYNVDIVRNGQKISNSDYYKDFNTEEKKINKFGGYQSSYQPTRPTNEYVEQVDPNLFFGSSMKGLKL